MAKPMKPKPTSIIAQVAGFVSNRPQEKLEK
jgi:hypothetical protein